MDSNLAGPTRRELLRILRGGQASHTGEIGGEFSISRPAVHKQLRVLYDDELVTRRKKGRNRLYGLRPEPMREAWALLERYRRFSRDSLAGLKHHTENEQQQDE